MNLYMMWPIALAVVAEIFYQVSAKSLPGNLNPFASLTITYLVAAAVCAVAFVISRNGSSFLDEFSKMNWTTYALGFALMCMEAASIYMYKVGWTLNTGYICKAIILSIALILVGYILYKESFTWNKAAGIGACLVGLYLINK